MTACRFFSLIFAGFFIVVFPIALRAQLYVVNSPKGAISEYDSTTGALIKDSLVTGLGRTRVMVYDNGALYVINDQRRTVAKYDAKTGNEINSQLVTGLDMPTALAVSGRDLYVASFNGADSDIVGKYDAVTGAVVYFKLIPKLEFTTGLAVHGNHLFVAHGSGLVVVDEYDAITGKMLKERFIPEMADPAVMAQSGNNFWVSHAVGVITKHDFDTGRNSFGMRLPLVSGLAQTCAIAVSGDDLFIASWTGALGKYNASTGAVINTSFITGLATGVTLAAVPSQDDESRDSWALLFDKRNFIRILAPIPAWVVDAVGLSVLLLIIALIVSPFLWVRARSISRREAVFPNGIRKVTILSFAGAPNAGCTLISDSVQSQLACLQVGDIIVALDSTQVENEEQYVFVDASANDSQMRWILWRGNRYEEIAAWVPDRKLDAGLQTYSSTSEQLGS